jgi:aminopeptidase N
MWFGDLVSPASWKYLWLNEAFATYFTYVIPHHYYPDWGVWEQFFPERMLPGLARDALAGSVPIDLPEDDDPAADPAPTPSTAPIVYNKGAAVIRMLEAYLGEAAFRQALHDFLAQYQFAAATSEQFWEAVARSAGVSLQAFARTWIHQPGHPLVTVERTGETLHLSQRRFGSVGPASETVWVIPVDILFFLDDGSVQERQVILDGRSLTLDLPKTLRAYKLNAGFTGFYRVQYPEQDWQRLGGLIKNGRLSSVDSLNVLDDLFALLTMGAYSISAYLQFVEDYLGEENRYLPLTNLARNLARLYLVNGGRRAQISALGLPIFERALDEMHWDPQDSEPLVTTELRETLLWAAFALGSTRVADFALSRFQKHLQGEAIHRDLVATLLKIGAALHPQGPDSLWAVAVNPEQAEAERIMALQALGNLPARSQQILFLDKNLTHIPNSLQSHMIQACARSLTGRDWLWDWFSEHLPRLEGWPLTATERLLVGVIPLIGVGRRAEAIRILDNFADRHPRAGASMQMALELLTINQHLQEI